MKTLVMIPAYNEGANIRRVVEGLTAACPNMDYVVINDGSRDETAQICRENGYELLDLPVNLGLAGAFSAGMSYAYRNDYDAAIQFDGDGQHRPEYLGGLVALLEAGADIAIGSRFVSEKKPFTPRMFGNRLIALAILIATGRRITDPTSGLRAYNRLMIMEFATMINTPPEPDTVSYLLMRGAKVEETQVKMDERIAGASYLNAIGSLKYMLRMFVSILVVQPFREKRPIHPAVKKEGVPL